MGTDETDLMSGSVKTEGISEEQRRKILTVNLQDLLSEEPTWRASAASLLGELGDKRAVPALITALGDKEKSVRREVASALGNLEDKRAVPVLVNTLLKDENEFVRAIAARSLGKLGDKEAVPALIKSLKDENVTVRVIVANALGKLGGKEAIDPLAAATCEEDNITNPDVRKAIFTALNQINERVLQEKQNKTGDIKEGIKH